MTVDELYEPGYLAANPDLQRANCNVREHFLIYGQREGRLQSVNEKQIAEMREEKLRRIRFRREPVRPRRYGHAANFLSTDVLAEFGIPEMPPISSNAYGGPFLEEVRHSPDKLCLDVGAGLRFSCFSNVINTEIYPSLSTDVVCVGEDLPFEDDQFDYVTCTAVLEHALKPWEVARELCRVLKPGGRILIGYPFLQAVHGYPHHYFNATPLGAISLFEPYCEIESTEIGLHQHPIYSLWGILNMWSQGLGNADRDNFEELTVKGILEHLPEVHLTASYCTRLNEETQRMIASASTVIGKKRARMHPAEPVNTESQVASKEREPIFTGTFRLQSELKNARAQLKQMDDTVAALRIRETALERIINDVITSRSWRVTALLRAAARTVRRLKDSAANGMGISR